ncbi:MAG: hypothetical protein KAH48_01265 [Chlorobi bacterium]|nr:hypothetical protein [Chlorobiota bacterium]
MKQETKLKPNRNISGFIFPITSYLVLGVTSVLYGIAAGLDAMAVCILIIAGISTIEYVKTGNHYGFIAIVYMLVLAAFLFELEPAQTGFKKFYLSDIGKILLIGVMFMMLCLAYLMITKKLKWRGREIMEIAAKDAVLSDDSYTERPRPVGKADYRKGELLEFVKFLSSNQIALAQIETEQVLLLPVKMGREYNMMLNPNIDYTKKTWVAFDFEGNVSSYISRQDYLDYKENLSLDMLSKSLGELYIEFFELYQKGEKSRVIDILNEIKVGVFS